MSDTPRTDAAIDDLMRVADGAMDLATFTRKLERELNELKASGHATKQECFHAEICLSEALNALDCDAFAPEFKVKRITEERDDYIEAFTDRNDVDGKVLRQFDEMLDQLPSL